MPTGIRWLTGLLGVLIVVAGVLALSHPFTALVYLAIVIGIGWLAEGIADIMSAVQGGTHPRWLGFVSGILSILGGIVIFTLPGFGYSVFLYVGSIVLIIAGLFESFFALPKVFILFDDMSDMPTGLGGFLFKAHIATHLPLALAVLALAIKGRLRHAIVALAAIALLAGSGVQASARDLPSYATPPVSLASPT